MAINKYDSPAQDRYQNTYVPVPYEQLMGTVVARQAQLDKEQDMLNKTYEDTKNLKYIPGTKDEEYVRNYMGKASSVVDKYFGADLSDPVVKQQMRSEFNNITDKQTLQNIQTSHSAWMNNQKYKAQLKAEGLYDTAIDEDPANATWDTAGSGKVYDYITSPFKNPRPAAETYFNNIKPTDLGDDGQYFYQGVTKDKINEVADSKWNEFANTSEGSLYVKKIAREQGLDYKDPNVKRQIATEYLKGVGNEFTFRDKAGISAGARGRTGGKEEPSPYVNSVQEQSIRATDDFDPFGIGKVNFDKEGNIVPDPQKKDPYVMAKVGSEKNIYADKPTNAQWTSTRSKEIQAQLNTIRERLPQLKGLSDKETYTAYRDLIKDGKAFPDLPKVDLPDVARTGLAGMLANSFLDRKIKVQDEFGSSDLRLATDDTQNSPLEDLGYTTQEFKDQLALAAAGNKDSRITVGAIAQNGPEAGMLQLEVYDNSKKGGKAGKGRPRKVYISTSEEMKAIMAPSNEIYNNIRNFKEGTTPMGWDTEGNIIATRVKPNVSKNKETGKWEYSYDLEEGYMGKDNTFTPTGKTTMENVRKFQMRQLTNSNYLNTAVNYTKTNAPSF